MITSLASVSSTIRVMILMTIFSINILKSEEIKDSFSQGTGQLNGMQTETGGAVWNASPNLVVEDRNENGAVSPSSVNPFFAHIPVPNTASSISVAADITAVPGQNTEEGWIALGFGAQDAENSLTWGDGTFVALNSSGEFHLATNWSSADNKAKAVLKKGLAPVFHKDSANKVELRYDRPTNTVAVLINGEVAAESIDLPSVPEISIAGFSGYSQRKSHAHVDNVSINFH